VSLVLFFLSLAASASAELIEALVHMRARKLVQGVTALVGEELKKAIYAHPLVAGLSRASTELVSQKATRACKLPSYIPAPVFARALASALDSLVAPKAAPDVTSALPDDSRMKAVLKALAPQGVHRVEDVLKDLEGWYNAGMDRVSGWYKRYSQLVLLILGLLFGVVLNVDLISVTQTVAQSSALRENLVAAARVPPSPTPDASPTGITPAVERLASLSVPLGWKCKDAKDPRAVPRTPLEWTLKVLGLLLTALGVSLGAPFWFDVLNRLSVVRATVK